MKVNIEYKRQGPRLIKLKLQSTSDILTSCLMSSCLGWIPASGASLGSIAAVFRAYDAAFLRHKTR